MKYVAEYLKGSLSIADQKERKMPRSIYLSSIFPLEGNVEEIDEV